MFFVLSNNVTDQWRIQNVIPGGGGGGFKMFLEKCGSAFAREVRGHAPPRTFLKMVQFDAFWRIFC